MDVYVYVLGSTQVECLPVCGLPGAQLGALVAKSETFECTGPSTCSPTLNISATDIALNKAVTVAGELLAFTEGQLAFREENSSL